MHLKLLLGNYTKLVFLSISFSHAVQLIVYCLHGQALPESASTFYWYINLTINSNCIVLHLTELLSWGNSNLDKIHMIDTA